MMSGYMRQTRRSGALLLPLLLACLACACGEDEPAEPEPYEAGDLGADAGGEGAVGDGTGGPGGSGSACTTAEVRTLLQASCGTAGCHGAGSPAAELDLTVADPGSTLTDAPAVLCNGAPLVVAGDPEASLLWEKVASDTPACGSRMPLGSVLPAADIDCIASWITALGSGAADCETCGGTACVDLETDKDHCGACDAPCAAEEICGAGSCQGCPASTTVCGTSCADTTTDPFNCGACGEACGVGQVCEAGACGCGSSAAVSFAADIEPLLDNSCGARGCHSGPRPQQSLSLVAGTSRGALVGVASTQCGDGRPLVTAGDPSNSYLLNKLTGVDMCSGSLMPKGAGTLQQAQTDAIAAWICAGAPDN